MPGTEVGITIYKPFIDEEKKYIYASCGAFISQSAGEKQRAEHTAVAASGPFC